MQCPACRHENADSARFCNSCGAVLTPNPAGLGAPPSPASFAGGRYTVEKKLGEGGKGIVFLCQDGVLGRRVAVKLIKQEVMDPDSLARFQREVQAMARLVHSRMS